MRNTTINDVLLAMTLSSCGATSTSNQCVSRNAEPSDTGGMSAQPDGTDDAGVVVGRCDNVLQTALTLETLPPGLAVFHSLSSCCETLHPVFLVRNTGSSSVLVDEIRITPEQFSVEIDDLPRELEPGDSMPLRLGFKSTTETNIEGTLTIFGPDGCLEFPEKVSGIAVRDSLISQDTYAWDFGDVAVGTTSEPVEVAYIYQNGDPLPVKVMATKPSVAGNEAFAADAFRLVSSPQTSLDLMICEKRRMSVTFTAPNTPGRVEGFLSYETIAETPEGEAAGLVVVYLYGNAIKR